MENTNETPGNTERDTAEGAEAAPASQVAAAGLGPGTTLGGTVHAINRTVLEVSPVVAVAGAYLGASLASQIGFFSATHQYQQQSMVGMAVVAANVRRLLSGAKTRRESTSGIATSRVLRESAPAPSPEKHPVEAAMERAEAAMKDTQAAMQDTGF